MFKVGDKVCKTTGYHYAGTIIASYTKTTGEQRYDVEFVGIGMIHVFSPEGLMLITDEQFKDCEDAMRLLSTTLHRIRHHTRQQELPL